MSISDARIAARQDYIIYSGETWKETINLVDANNSPLSVAGATLGTLTMYKGESDTVLATITSGAGTSLGTNSIVINKLMPVLRKDMSKGNYYEQPLILSNGTKMIFHGYVKVDWRK